MKNLKKTNQIFILFLSIFSLISCSKDNNEEPKPKLSERKEYLFTTITNIPDDGSANLEIPIIIGDNRTIIDPTKVKLELKLEHGYASDLLVMYKNPTGTYKGIFIFVGSSNDFISTNTLSFGTNHTLASFIIEDGYKIAAGNYNSMSNDIVLNPVEKPLFEQLRNKNINGTWKFFFSDVLASYSGKVHSIKLIFEEGALSVI